MELFFGIFFAGMRDVGGGGVENWKKLYGNRARNTGNLPSVQVSTSLHMFSPMNGALQKRKFRAIDVRFENDYRKAETVLYLTEPLNSSHKPQIYLILILNWCVLSGK